jgi:hypothetical protein
MVWATDPVENPDFIGVAPTFASGGLSFMFFLPAKNIGGSST